MKKSGKEVKLRLKQLMAIKNLDTTIFSKFEKFG